jgi:hypothetical protein
MRAVTDDVAFGTQNSVFEWDRIENPRTLHRLRLPPRCAHYQSSIGARNIAIDIKPFDFLLSCHVKVFGYPPDVDLEKFHLVAPYVPAPEWVGGWQDHERRGYGVIADILLGIVGEIVGGWVVGLLGFGSGGMI